MYYTAQTRLRLRVRENMETKFYENYLAYIRKKKHVNFQKVKRFVFTTLSNMVRRIYRHSLIALNPQVCAQVVTSPGLSMSISGYYCLGYKRFSKGYSSVLFLIQSPF